ncbi:MAG: LpxD N-terminal domain-containing protein, partial [Rhizobiaceae bacterium]
MSDPVFFSAVPVTLEQIAKTTGAELKSVELADLSISSASPIEAASPGAITFIDNPRYLKHAENTQAAAVICAEKHAGKISSKVGLLVHENPYKTYA